MLGRLGHTVKESRANGAKGRSEKSAGRIRDAIDRQAITLADDFEDEGADVTGQGDD
jgi:hypothetical protein